MGGAPVAEARIADGGWRAGAEGSTAFPVRALPARLQGSLRVGLLAGMAGTVGAAEPNEVMGISAAVRERLGLSSHYTKFLDAGGLPIVASEKVPTLPPARIVHAATNHQLGWSLCP
jgi:hypothetical protein